MPNFMVPNSAGSGTTEARKPKPQGKGIVKALGQKKTTGDFAKIEQAKGKGAAIGALQNKLAKKRGQKVPYGGAREAARLVPNGDPLREAKWSEDDRTAALEPQPAKRIKDERATEIATDWFNGQDSAMYLFAKTGGEIKSENVYRRLKSEISDALRMVISNPNYTPEDASDLHALMGHVRAIGQEQEYEGAKKGQTASGYYSSYYSGGGCCSPTSATYPY